MAQALTLETHRLYSLEEFEAMDLPNDNNKYELIDGAVKMSPPPSFLHSHIANNIVWQIIRFDLDRKLGRVYQDTGFQVAPGFGPIPDVAFLMAENIPTPSIKGMVPHPPDLAVEVWSPGDLDTAAHKREARAKIRDYQKAGVALVWAINPPARQVEVYHPYQIEPVQVLGIEDDLSGEDVIPGFTMPVKALFEV